MRAKTKLWIHKDGEQCFGSGKATILRAVLETGSLNAAARNLGMSYRHAWSAIHAAEGRLGKALLIRTKGGSKGGGAILTRYARRLLERFEQLDREVKEFTEKQYKQTFGNFR